MCVYGLKYYYIILYNIYWIFKDQNVVVPSKTNCAAGKTLFGGNGKGRFDIFTRGTDSIFFYSISVF